MKLVQVIFAITFLLFTVTGFAARQEKTLICHVGNEVGPSGEEYDPTCVPEEANDFFCADAGKIDLIVVAQKAADKHLENPSHEWDGISDYKPGDLGASGEGTEDSDGNGIDDGCELPAGDCPCWAESELQSVTAENNFAILSCSTGSIWPLFALIQNDESEPEAYGGFAAVAEGTQSFCTTRDSSNDVSTTVEEADACIAQIAARCAGIGDPITP